MTSFNEQRHFTRIPFDADVTLTSTDGQLHFKASLIDICLKGALTTRPEDWQANNHDAFTLELNLSAEDESTHLTMEVNVAHTEENQIGFEVNHMDLDTATHLHRLVELNLGDERLLKRELSDLINT